MEARQGRDRSGVVRLTAQHERPARNRVAKGHAHMRLMSYEEPTGNAPKRSWATKAQDVLPFLQKLLYNINCTQTGPVKLGGAPCKVKLRLQTDQIFFNS